MSAICAECDTPADTIVMVDMVVDSQTGACTPEYEPVCHAHFMEGRQ